jgi:hypothetical protein
MARARIWSLLLGAALLSPGCTGKADRIEVSPKKLKIYGIDRPQRLTARILDKKGKPLEIGTANWESGNAAIAAVDSGGLVTPKAEGKTKISAVYHEIRAEIPIEIVDVKSLEVSPPSAHLVGPVGTQFQLQTIVKNSKDKNITFVPVWTSSKPEVASVSADGLVTSAGTGTVTLVAKIGDVQGASDIAVDIRDIGRLEVRPATALVRVGDSQRFEVVAFDVNGRAMEGLAAIFKSSAPDVARVDAAGHATGTKTGASTIRAIVGSASAEATLIVN